MGVTYACDTSVLLFSYNSRSQLAKKYEELTGQLLGITGQLAESSSSGWKIGLGIPHAAAILIGEHAGAMGATA